MPDYSKSIIYCIYSTLQNADENDVYYGSTVNIKSRWNGHKTAYKDYLNNNGKKNCTSINIFDKYGIENCTYKIIEKYPCNTKTELLEKEKYYIISNNCVNKQTPNKTDDEKKQAIIQYRIDNKEKIHKRQIQYRIDNKEKIHEWQTQYREENKDKINERYNKMYENNKDKIKEQKKEYRKNNEDKVKESNKKYYENNKEKVLEICKRYRENNQEKIKEYCEKNREKILERKKQYNEKYKEEAKKKRNK